MKKSLISVFLAVVMLFSLCIPGFATESTAATVKGTYENGTVTITGTLPENYLMVRIYDTTKEEIIATGTKGPGGELNLQIETGTLVEENDRYKIWINGADSLIGDGWVEFKSTPTTPTTPSTGGGGGGSSTSKPKDTTLTVKPEVDGTTASVTLSNTQANKLVNDAINNKSENVIVKVKAPDNATEVSATIPAAALKKLADRTKAKLIVETPVANITLPNEALKDVGDKSGNVTITAAKGEDESVKITVAKDGTELSSIKGGIVAAVPMKDATSGTVAMLVNADGTKTVIKKSVAKDGSMIVPLNGSATLVFGDNSKVFDDIGSHWGKDAVAFVSSRDLFRGTSETSFSPDTTMNRAMLVTVLHRLEDTPVGGSIVFGDVNSGEWYTEAVAWATSNKIVNGYDDGSFKPGNPVTREQIAVILFRYAENYGLDTTQRGSLTGFTDGDETSSWAQDAMKWAVSVKLFQGKGNNNLDPKGNATRAEVAKLLMGFVEYMA